MKGLKLAVYLVVGIAVVIGLPVLVAGREKTLAIIFGPMDLKPVDFAALRLADKPNQFLVCPPDFCADTAHLTSPVFPGSAEQLKQRWMAMVEKQPRVEAGAADEAAMQYEFIQRSKLVGYPDSITVRFIALDEGKATLAIYSRSHYGRSDFGVNEARVRAWLAALAGS